MTKAPQFAEIVSQIKQQHPDWKLFQVMIADKPDEIYLARKTSWGEYKGLIGNVQDEAEANEVLVQRYLVHPKVDYEAMQTQWEPGLVVQLAQGIQKGLGFSQGATAIKNV